MHGCQESPLVSHISGVTSHPQADGTQYGHEQDTADLAGPTISSKRDGGSRDMAS